MRILLTNTSLFHRAGSELYLFELATRLLECGHSPVAFSTRLGPLAEALRKATIPVVDRLDAIGEPPDLIHGQHHVETLTALLHFPGVPALFVCHGWLPWEEDPPRFPRILRYVAVDHTTRERLVSERGIPPERVEVVLNFVDLARFRPRGPLPSTPRRALVFSNQASERTYLPAVREACARSGIDVDVAGLASGVVTERPEELLVAYDLVFAKARAALEALAVGTAVVLCDETGAGPLVTSRNLDELRPLNFGVRTLRHPVAADYLASQIERYDPADAAEVAQRIRATAGIEEAVDRMIGIYERVLGEHREQGNPPPADESRAAAAYLQWLNPYLRERIELLREREGLRAEIESFSRELGDLRHQAESREEEHSSERGRLASEAGMLRADVGMLRDEAALVHREIAMLRQTATWRLRERLLRLTLPVKLYRFIRHSKIRERHVRTAAEAGDPAPRNPSRETARLPEGHATLEEKARRMEAEGGFLGVPVEEFESEGRLQLAALLRHGLRPDSKLLDIGCGCLRGGYWLIHFLQPGCYCGIEPRKDRLQLGLSHLFAPTELADKQPRFDHNPEFDSSVFGERFDFFLARSIWTHASKPQIARMLDAFLRDTDPAAKFLTSYVPPEPPHRPELMGEAWIGTGLESSVPGIAYHSFEWIERECRARGLEVRETSQNDYGGQRWVLVRRAEN
ncbi:MAG TPA: glycosyltransferase [Thermoanaerobaculia bacterium]|nr:glycosyltransferase [Thermoanaerobaculia bacterium]